MTINLLKVKVLFPDFSVEGLPKILDFGDFVLIWRQADRKQRNLKAKLQGPVYLNRTANCLINYRIR